MPDFARYMKLLRQAGAGATEAVKQSACLHFIRALEKDGLSLEDVKLVSVNEPETDATGYVPPPNAQVEEMLAQMTEARLDEVNREALRIIDAAYATADKIRAEIEAEKRVHDKAVEARNQRQREIDALDNRPNPWANQTPSRKRFIK